MRGKGFSYFFMLPNRYGNPRLTVQVFHLAGTECLCLKNGPKPLFPSICHTIIVFSLDFSACGVYIIQFICFSIQFCNNEQPETTRERRLHDGE